MSAHGCRSLWAAVLLQALSDSLHLKQDAPKAVHADAWLRRGRDMLMVAALAGLDGHVIRQKYVAGQIELPKHAAPGQPAGREAKRKAA